MQQQPHPLKLARQRQGWSQEQAIVRIEKLARSMGIALPARSSLRTLLSMFENGHRGVPEQYRPILRELYRSTDQELGFTVANKTPNSLVASLVPLPRHPGRPTPEILSYLLNVFRENTRADAQTGPQYILPLIYPQLSLIEQLCQSAREPERRATLFIGAKYAEFCGWLCQDSGDTNAAIHWTNQALDYAHELDDPELLAYVLTRKSNIATEAGSPGHGLGLANAALNIPGSIASTVRAVSLRHRARAHSLLAEKNDFEHDTSEALAYAADAPPAKESYVTIDAGVSWDHAKYCTPAYITMEAGMSWVDFSKPNRAIEIFHDSLRTWPSSSQVRDRGLCLARLATASAIQHDVEPAYEAAAEALTIAQVTGSARIRGQLVSAYNQLKVVGNHPAVQELGHQLAALTAGQNHELSRTHQQYH
jgi:transcriptional regulator with XRE-family HTH domain